MPSLLHLFQNGVFMTARLTLTRPDDWHLHLRDGAAMASVLPHTAREFGRAIVMPNLRPPVTTLESAMAYRERILEALPQSGPESRFEPLMTLYLTDNTSPEELRRAKASGKVHGVKLYPSGATTNSDHGVTDLNKVQAALETMAEIDLPLLIHGEVTDHTVDVFDREAVFIDTLLSPLLQRLPELRVILEHITTRQAAEFVASASERVAATITVHHLMYNRNSIFQGGIRPHMYCLPILKREVHREALVAAAISGSPKFFLGTDSAPHPKGAKEAACGCAGIYTAHAALPLYAEVFEDAGALDKLEGFASFYGPDFYRLPRNTETVELVREDWEVPAEYAFGAETIFPLRAGETVRWRIVDRD
jgi:dihydroorotase